MLAFDRRKPHPMETVMTRIQRCLGVLAAAVAAVVLDRARIARRRMARPAT